MKKLEEYVEEEDRVTRSIVQSIEVSTREIKRRGKERAKNIFATRSNGGGISTNLSHLTVVHDGQATITRATITTCTHSRSCQISARVATRPITSLLESEGKGESLLFLLGRERDERNNFWIRLGESRNRNRFLFHFYKIVAENCSFLCCVKTFLFDPGSKEKNRSKERSFPFNFDRFPYFSKD